MHRGASVVAGQQRIQLSRVRPEGVGEGLRNPARMGVYERGMSDWIAVRGWGEFGDPGLFVAPRNGSQHSVDETGSRGIEFDSRLFDGGGYRRVLFDPGAQQLVGAEPQQVQQHGIDILGWSACRLADDRVEQAASAARAVGEFGGE